MRFSRHLATNEIYLRGATPQDAVVLGQAGWSARHDLILTNQLPHLAASRPIRCGGDAHVVRGAKNTTPAFGQSPLRDVHVHSYWRLGGSA